MISIASYQLCFVGTLDIVCYFDFTVCLDAFSGRTGT